jgi:3-hydroxyacyl-[acyl-carrier-protein] dehydratase
VKSTHDHIDFKKFLPHRDPMLMVSRLLYIDETTAHSEFIISKDCVFVKNNVLSETGLIENAAQACSAIVGQSYFETDDLEGERNKVVGYISAIKKVEIYNLPKVGNVVTTKAKLISRFDTGSVTMCSIECDTFNSDKLIVACTLNFLIHEVQ